MQLHKDERSLVQQYDGHVLAVYPPCCKRSYAWGRLQTRFWTGSLVGCPPSPLVREVGVDTSAVVAILALAWMVVRDIVEWRRHK